MTTYQTDPREGAKMIAKLAEDALSAFRADDKNAYAELVKQYEGAAVVVGVFGIGAVTLAVQKGAVKVNPDTKDVGKLSGRAAVYSGTVAAIADGKLTVMEAYHRNELVVRAPSATLHEAYDSFCKHAESALKSKRLRKNLAEFRKFAGV